MRSPRVRFELDWLVDSMSSFSSSLGKSSDREARNGAYSVGFGWMVALDLPLPLSNALELDSTGTGADAGSATGNGECGPRLSADGPVTGLGSNIESAETRAHRGRVTGIMRAMGGGPCNHVRGRSTNANLESKTEAGRSTS